MDDATIRAALERHWADLADQETVHEIYHDDVVLEFPQSGERLRGLANVRAMRTAYPADVANTMRRIRGAGDLWVAEQTLTYDGAQPTHAITVMEFRDGKVVHETIYFGEPWEPPAWRAQWMERSEG
jgi:ketosteroid isomerase-like protein